MSETERERKRERERERERRRERERGHNFCSNGNNDKQKVINIPELIHWLKSQFDCIYSPIAAPSVVVLQFR